MKIFNEENGVKKVYVQINDIYTIQEFSEEVPSYVYETVMDFGDAGVDKNFGMCFREYSKPNEVKFFESCDWILDYKKYRNYSIERLESEMGLCDMETDNIHRSIDGLTTEERKQRQEDIQRIYLLNYKRNYIASLIEYKKGNLDMRLPLIPDSDASYITRDSSFPYEFRPCIDGKRLLICKRDGEYFGEDEKVPEDFIKMALSIIMVGRRKYFKDEDYDVVNYISGKYYVIEFVKKEKKLEETPEKGIMKLVHKIFPKKN